MPVAVEDCVDIEVQEGTPGGDTYFIRTKGSKHIQKVCFRKIRKNSRPDNEHDWRCARMAGYKTSHLGAGACVTHGGSDNAVANAVVTGKYAVRTRETLQHRIDALMLDQDALMDMRFELASMKALYAEFIAYVPTPDNEEYGIMLQRLSNLVGSTGTLMEKISKVEARANLTAAHVAYLKASIIDLFMKYIDDPKVRENAVLELQERIAISTFSTKGVSVPRLGSGND